MKQIKQSKTKKYITALAVLLFWIGVWQGAFMFVKKDILIASPMQVLERLAVLVKTADFWKSVFMSFLRIISGYLLGVFFAVVLAVLTKASSAAMQLMNPIIRLIRATPVASFIILALVWIKKSYIPVFIVFLIVLPIIWQNVTQGIESTDKRLLESAKIYGFGFIKTVRTVYFHSVLPSFGAGCVTALGLAWKSGVAAEVLSMPVFSIGYNLYRSKINIETADLFAWTAVVIVLSVIIERIVSKLIAKLGGKKNA